MIEDIHLWAGQTKNARSGCARTKRPGLLRRARAKGERLSGTDPNNINNQNASGESVQLEISTAQRKAFLTTLIREKERKKAFSRYVSGLKEVLREFDPSS